MLLREEDLKKMSVEQRLLLIDALWNSLAGERENEPISQAHASE